MEPTKAILTIEVLQGDPIDFVSLELYQCIFDHHRVTIVIDLKQIGENVFESPMAKTSLINEKIQIDLQVGDDAGGAYGFIGIITHVDIDLDAGDHGLLYVYAASPTIELERGKMFQTFSETSLKQIFNEVTQSIRFLNLTNKPKYTSPIKFSMQYKETDFQYLQRLAWMYGEKFFFSGDSLVFGEFEEKDPVEVTYDLDLKEVRVGTRLIANVFQQYYHDINNKKNPFEFPYTEAGTFAGEASLQSDKLNLRKKPDMPMDVPTFDEGTLQYLTEMRKKRTFTNMFHVTGKTKLYKVRIGGLLKVNFHGKMKADEDLGMLRVIRVRHVLDETGHYYNEFEAVPSKHGYFPYPDINFPMAQAIPATVVANEDPDGIGKIQVKFDFETKACDYWIPLMTPEGGGMQDNRGFVFIPEVNDKVLISFFEGNPEFPFTLGSMFHGESGKGQGGGKGNHIKSIRDKSGSEVVLNDKDGSITLTDKTGNDTIIIDGTDKISIITTKTIELNNGQSSILMDEDSIAINSNNIVINGEKVVAIVSKGEQMIATGEESCIAIGGTDITVSAAKTTNVSGGSELAANSPTVTVAGSTIVDVTGGLIKLNS